MYDMHRAASVAATCEFTSSFAPRYPHYMHTTPPSSGNVLQVRVGGGLHESMGTNGSFRLRVGVGVARTRTLVVIHASG